MDAVSFSNEPQLLFKVNWAAAEMIDQAVYAKTAAGTNSSDFSNRLIKKLGGHKAKENLLSHEAFSYKFLPSC